MNPTSAADLGMVHVFHPARSGGSRTLLLLHGTGGDEHDLLPLAPLLDPEAAVLSPRGNVLERGMPRFFRRLAEGVFDEADLIARTHELAAFVTAAATRYRFDPAGVVAAGFSNGANIAAATMLLRPEMLRRAILFSPMVPLAPPAPPDLRGAAAFLGAGRNDPIAPPAGVERLAAMLREAGAETEVWWAPGGHALTRDEIDAARAWLERLPA